MKFKEGGKSKEKQNFLVKKIQGKECEDS